MTCGLWLCTAADPVDLVCMACCVGYPAWSMVPVGPWGVPVDESPGGACCGCWRRDRRVVLLSLSVV